MKIRKIYVTTKFSRNFKNLPVEIKRKAASSEIIFRSNPFDKRLKTHKLKGVLREFYSFSVGYRYRVLFSFENGDKVTFVDVGTHKIYQ